MDGRSFLPSLPFNGGNLLRNLLFIRGSSNRIVLSFDSSVISLFHNNDVVVSSEMAVFIKPIT